MASHDDFLHQLAQEAEEQIAQQSGGTQSHTYTDPSDGTEYEWDFEKKAWFPKLSEDFMLAYQANYGQSETSSSAEPNLSSAVTTKPPVEAKPNKKMKKGMKDLKPKPPPKPVEPPGWFDVDEKHNTNVYVSNLPSDITDVEFVEFMSKCGVIMKEPDTGKLKIKLYTDDNGQLKGDGRCCYMKVESVDLALKILDGYQMRDKEVKVQRATFQLKGQYDPSKKPKKRKAKDKNKLQNKLFDWRPERPIGVRAKHEKVVIIRNMFDIKEFEEDATLILEYQSDLREECSKFGAVKKVMIYDRHPEGIASISFKEPEMADACIEALNGRWFAGRQLHAEVYDGKTKFSIQETDAEQQQRMKQWETFLEKDEKNASSSQVPNIEQKCAE